LRICPAGTYRNIKGECISCPEGSFSSIETADRTAYECTLCPPGSYADETGSTGCLLCPQGTYNPLSNQTSASSCETCPAGRITPFPGATLESDCLTPAPNFIMGFLALFVATILLIIYIVRGRFHRVAFIRYKRSIEPIKNEIIKINFILSEMIENVDQRKDNFSNS
jgi:hypothetical protein